MAEESLESVESKLEQDPANPELLLKAARFYHEMAMQGDEAAFEKADRSIVSLLARDDRNAEALSIYGSLFTIRVKRSRSFFRRLFYSVKAARLLDRAVRTDPANVTARTIRAFTSLVLPGFLRRLGTAVADFEYLIERKHDDPTLVPDEMMPKVYYNLAVAHAKTGNRAVARRVLQDVIERFPQTRECERARSLLERLNSVRRR